MSDQAQSMESIARDFTNALLISLRDPEIRQAYLAIVDEGISQHVAGLERKVQEDERRISVLEDKLQKVTKEKDELQYELQDLLQYTRRNAVRISNPAWVEPPENPREPEDTDALVLELAATLGVRLEPWEIGRSHRVGKKRPGVNSRPILVKFLSYNIRRRIFEARKSLKDHGLRNVYINEDLTRQNNKLAYEARQLKKQRQILDTFTRDGRIYIKRHVGENPKVIRDLSHLQSEVLAPTYGEMVQTRQPDAAAPPSPHQEMEYVDDSAGSESLLQVRLPSVMRRVNDLTGHTFTSTPVPSAAPLNTTVTVDNQAGGARYDPNNKAAEDLDSTKEDA